MMCFQCEEEPSCQCNPCEVEFFTPSQMYDGCKDCGHHLVPNDPMINE